MNNKYLEKIALNIPMPSIVSTAKKVAGKKLNKIKPALPISGTGNIISKGIKT